MRTDILLLATLTLAACASTSENLQIATAGATGAKISDVVINNVNRGATTVTWDALISGQPYICGADDMVRRTTCAKKE